MLLLPMPQDALRDPQKWDSDWDALLRRELAFPNGPVLCFNSKLAENEAIPDGVDRSLISYQSFVTTTCAIQRNITEEALHHFTHNDFEAKWMKAGADVRGRHILGAMAAVCSKARNLNEARAYCPEIRLMRLRLDGKVFLNLLKSVMLEDASFIPSEPIYVSHPGWDAWAAGKKNLNATEAIKIALAEILILRTKLICHIVQFTMRSFFGEDPPQLVVRKQQRSIDKGKSHMSAQRAELAATVGPAAAKARAKEERAGAKDRFSQRLGICSYMGCVNKEPPDGSVKFMRCKPCFEKMRRQVVYCSRTCQTADWKLHHKAVCGKPIDFDTATKVIEHPTNHGPMSHMRIGLPINGYKRSIPLTAQVTALNMYPTVDYHIEAPDGEKLTLDFGAGSYVQETFRIYRELAMTTGDLSSVAQMAHFICAMCICAGHKEKWGITPNTIVAQLAREFVLDDLCEAVLYAQRMQNDDPLRRPPLLADTPPDLWESLNQVLNLSDVVVTFE
ncbi:hypothetical protein B0H13DRAFT_2010874 [Mycena leptocephala]|nr:hypothetical protein B0H13DRAFT_2010874 [Mycena leptocephala]